MVYINKCINIRNVVEQRRCKGGRGGADCMQANAAKAVQRSHGGPTQPRRSDAATAVQGGRRPHAVHIGHLCE